MDNNKEEWSIPCGADDNEEFEPTPEELDSMYKILESGGTLELEWKCKGRRQPSPITTASNETEVQDTPEKEPAMKNLEFDFMDEVAAPSQMRSTNSTPKSAKKKTANFAGVLDAIKKHGRLSQVSSPKDSS